MAATEAESQILLDDSSDNEGPDSHMKDNYDKID